MRKIMAQKQVTLTIFLKRERYIYLDRWRGYKLLLDDAEKTISNLGQLGDNR